MAEKWLTPPIQAEMFDAIQDSRKFHYAEERSNMLEWISTINTGEMHANILTEAGHIVGGDWLLRSKLFKGWKDGAFHRVWYAGDRGYPPL